jgi:hypothetical protein
MNETSYTAKEYFVKLRHELLFEKSNRFLLYMRLENPGLEVHHILGSAIGKKYTDYLVVMLTRKQHIEAEKHKPYYAIHYLPKAIQNLINYVKYLESK